MHDNIDFSTPPKRVSPKVCTVDELSAEIKGILTASPALRNMAVRGEIQNFKRHSSGHVYFTLIGRDSRIAAVMFRSHAGNVLAWPEDGDEVVVTGSVDVYPKGGAYQLYVSRILPIGLGAQSRAKEALRRTLEGEGLFDLRHKRPLPRYPRKVAIVTSPTGAALQDILKVSLGRAPFVDIVLVPAVVQGVDAPPRIAHALAAAGARTDAECVILARGGGARDDLSPFDDERVVRAIRSCPLPVVTGVGHQTDSSLADLAADISLPTPSAAAERVFPDSAEIEALLAHRRNMLFASCVHRLQRSGEWVQNIGRRMHHALRSNLDDREKTLERSRTTLFSSMAHTLELAEGNLAALAARLDALSPLSVLSRGYAICKDTSGRVVRSVAALSPAAGIEVCFKDGSLDAKVVALHPHETERPS